MSMSQIIFINNPLKRSSSETFSGISNDASFTTPAPKIPPTIWKTMYITPLRIESCPLIKRARDTAGLTLAPEIESNIWTRIAIVSPVPSAPATKFPGLQTPIRHVKRKKKVARNSPKTARQNSKVLISSAPETNVRPRIFTSFVAGSSLIKRALNYQLSVPGVVLHLWVTCRIITNVTQNLSRPNEHSLKTNVTNVTQNLSGPNELYKLRSLLHFLVKTCKILSRIRRSKSNS